MLSETFKSAEIRVAAYNDLTAEQGRALYAAYVKRGIEIDQLNAELGVYARFAEKFGDLSCCYDADDVTAVIQRAFDELKESPDTTPHEAAKAQVNALFAHGCLTGDCPHNLQADCDASLLKALREASDARDREFAEKDSSR